MPAVTASRADRVVAALEEPGLDALIVTKLVNVRYLTGYSGSNGLAVVGRDIRRFITDFRYVTQAEAEVREFDRETAERDLVGSLAQGWPEGELRVGFEEAHVSVKAYKNLRETLPGRIELVGISDAVESARAIKEPDELDAIRAASAISSEIYGWLMEYGLVGHTERSLAVALEHEMRLLGAHKPSFDSIVASGEHSALPHAQPRDVAIAANTLVTFDLGCQLDGYCSDCTRTFATGPLDDDLAEIYTLVQRAQAAALAAVRPGPTGKEVDAVAREIIRAAGHGEHFGHGLGHGVGMEVHEAPTLSFRRGDDALLAGHVVTVEPGVYVPGRGGVRIEDLVFVTADGHENLTAQVTKDLVTVS